MNKIYFDIFIYKNESNSFDLESYNLEKECIKIYKFNPDNQENTKYVCEIKADMYDKEDKYVRTDLKQVIFDIEKDDWNIEGHEKSGCEYGKPSEISILDFFLKV